MEKKLIQILCSALCILLLGSVPLTCLTGCNGNRDDRIRIGVLREDDTSGEAKAWEKYLRTLGEELNFTVDFTTTNSSSAEVSAINTYASKGYRGILLFSDDDLVASINAAASKKMYIVYPVGQPTDEQYEQVKDNPYFLGSVAPAPDTEFQAGYDMATFFVDEKKQTTFTIFGGATAYGANMHIQRLVGILTRLCEQDGTSYDGVRDRDALAAKVAGNGIDPSKFKSDTFRITGYMDGFTFDDAFTTKLTNSMEAGGTCILSVGAGDVVSRIAYGITSANGKIGSFMSGGVDAITTEYTECFDLGYTYDCGKYASAMAPGLVLMLAALDGGRVTDPAGKAPRISMNYWIATSRARLEEMLAADSPETGYCYDAAVVRAYKTKGYSELVRLCGSDYEGARAIRNAVHAEESESHS